MNTMKLVLISLTLIALLMSGCISIKQADIAEATFNTSGWKSQAGVSGDAVIEATTIPTTDLRANNL